MKIKNKFSITLILVFLTLLVIKLLGVNISWWLVFSPVLLGVALTIFIIILLINISNYNK